MQCGGHPLIRLPIWELRTAISDLGEGARVHNARDTAKPVSGWKLFSGQVGVHVRGCAPSEWAAIKRKACATLWPPAVGQICLPLPPSYIR